MTTETYEILAIKYGEFSKRKRYESFISADDHDGPHPDRLLRLGDPQRQAMHLARRQRLRSQPRAPSADARSTGCRLRRWN